MLCCQASYNWVYGMSDPAEFEDASTFRQDNDEQRSQITHLISLGNEQNYLTYTQINDLLPNIVDTENFDIIINILEGMNIKVFEHPPSSDDLSLLGTTEEIPEDVEEAAAVLAFCRQCRRGLKQADHKPHASRTR